MLPPGYLERNGRSSLALLFAVNVALEGILPSPRTRRFKPPPVWSGGWEALSPLDTSLALDLSSPAGQECGMQRGFSAPPAAAAPRAGRPHWTLVPTPAEPPPMASCLTPSAHLRMVW